MYETRFKSRLVKSTGKVQIEEVRVWVPGVGDRVKLSKKGLAFWTTHGPGKSVGTVRVRTPYGCLVTWDSGACTDVQFQDADLIPA